jgi:hypothetical protein
MTAHPTEPMREGFWYGPHEPFLPMPVANTEDWPGRTRFLSKLMKLEEKLDAEGNVTAYRGFSVCRICGKGNGSEEFRHKGWIWPSGLSHYVAEHNVRPSLAFMEMVMGPLPKGRDSMEYAEAKAVLEIRRSEDADWMKKAFDLGDDNAKR